MGQKLSDASVDDGRHFVNAHNVKMDHILLTHIMYSAQHFLAQDLFVC